LQIPPDLREELGIGGRVTLEKTEDGGISIYPVAGAQPTVSTQEQDADSIDVQPASPQRTGLRRWLRRNKE
jgi:hypothetical protein